MSTIRLPAPPIAPKPLHLTTRGRAAQARDGALQGRRDDYPALPRWSAASETDERLSTETWHLTRLLGNPLEVDLPVQNHSAVVRHTAEASEGAQSTSSSSTITVKPAQDRAPSFVFDPAAINPLRPTQAEDCESRVEVPPAQDAVALYSFSGEQAYGELSFTRQSRLSIELENVGGGWSVGYVTSQGERARDLIPRGWYGYLETDSEVGQATHSDRNFTIVSGIEFDFAPGQDGCDAGSARMAHSFEIERHGSNSEPETTPPDGQTVLSVDRAFGTMSQASAKLSDSLSYASLRRSASREDSLEAGFIPDTWIEWVLRGCTGHARAEEAIFIETGPVWRDMTPFLTIDVGPGRPSSAIQTFVVYPITTSIALDKDDATTSTDLSAHRRYTHFALLDAYLRKQYPLLHLAPLPPKSVIGHLTTSFVANRARTLKRWLLRVSTHPVIRQDDRFRAFLSVENDKELESTLKESTCVCAFFANVFHPDFNIDEKDFERSLGQLQSRFKQYESTGSLETLVKQIRQCSLRHQDMERGDRELARAMHQALLASGKSDVPHKTDFNEGSRRTATAPSSRFVDQCEAVSELLRPSTRFKHVTVAATKAIQMHANLIANDQEEQSSRLETVFNVLAAEMAFGMDSLGGEVGRLVAEVKNAQVASYEHLRADGSSSKRKQDDDDGGASDAKAAKKSRLAMSCHECKRRKIKCDKVMPTCGPCSRRGRAADCSWDLLENESVLPPNLARKAEVDALLARLQHVEKYLATLPPNFATFKPLDVKPIERTSSQTLRPGTREDSEAQARPRQHEETFSDTEDAAIDLENDVFGKADKPISTGRSQEARHAAPDSRYAARSSELTAALTCIIAPLPAPMTSRAHLNVDFDASPADVERARIDAKHRIMRVLPPRHVYEYLVELYFSRVSWLFSHLHPPSFRAEIQAFARLVDEGKGDTVDLLWLALLLMIACVSLDGSDSSRSPLSLEPNQGIDTTPLAYFSKEQLKTRPLVWFEAAQRALALAEWETYPRVRSIQVIILFTQYLQLCSPHRGQPSQMMTWLAGAIRIAHTLGLHLLGSNPQTMPPDDPAWPPGKNSLKREIAKRLWGVLVYQDWLAASSKNRSYLISPYHFDTDEPLNVNDSDLSPFDWKIEAAPQAVLTDSTPDRIRLALARQVRKVFDAVVLSHDFTYETVLELDAGYRQILDSLPDRWMLEVSSEEREQPMMRFRRHFALEGINNRLFRLHRPFLTRGYKHEKYRFSTDACIRAARVVLVSTHNIRTALKDIWFSYSHVMGAALVLFNDLFHSVDSDASTIELEAKKSTLQLAFEIFSQSDIASPALQAVVDQGCKILSGLFKAEESRRVGRAARTLLAAGGGVHDEQEEETESFAEVLQRISRSLNTSSAPHRGTPPPTRNIRRAAARAGQVASGTSGQGVIGAGTDVPLASWLMPNETSISSTDQSLQWLQDLGMLDGNMEGGQSGGLVGNGLDAALYLGEGDEFGPGSFAVGSDFLPDAARMNGQGSQVSALLDQIGSGW